MEVRDYIGGTFYVCSCCDRPWATAEACERHKLAFKATGFLEVARSVKHDDSLAFIQEVWVEFIDVLGAAISYAVMPIPETRKRLEYTLQILDERSTEAIDSIDLAKRRPK